jgi:hypothetical protein
MWNEKLEAHAADMRKRAQMRRFLRLPDTPKVQSSLRNQQYVSRRISNDARQLGLEKGRATMKAKGDAYRNTVVSINTNNFQQDDKLRDPELRSSFPSCPHCQNSRPENTIRAGFANDIQRYRCQMCRRTFSGPTIVVRLEPCTPKYGGQWQDKLVKDIPTTETVEIKAG